MSDKPDHHQVRQIIDNVETVRTWNEHAVRVDLSRGNHNIGAVMYHENGTAVVELAGAVCNFQLSQPVDNELAITIVKDNIPVQRITLSLTRRGVVIKEDKANYDRPERN